jgi:Fic family protein
MNDMQDVLYKYVAEANTLAGRLAGVDEEEQSEALIDLMATEAIRTSRIEGEHCDRDDVRSSIRNLA